MRFDFPLLDSSYLGIFGFAEQGKGHYVTISTILDMTPLVI